MTNENEKKEKKKVPWKKRLTIGIVFLSILSFLGISCITYAIIKSSNTIKMGKVIRDELVPLCDSKNYVYDDIEGSRIKFNYYNEISSYGDGAFSEKMTSFKYYSVNFLHYSTDNYYYFLFEFEIKSGHHEYSVYRADNELNSFEEIVKLGENITCWKSGLGNKMFYESKGHYYAFDFVSLLIDKDDEYGTYKHLCNVESNDYLSFYGVNRGKCKRINGACSYSFGDEEHTFYEERIDDNILHYIFLLDFEPLNYYSFSSGKTIILYYSGGDLLGMCDCLLVEYSRSEDKVCGYQMFQSCHKENFSVFCKTN